MSLITIGDPFAAITAVANAMASVCDLAKVAMQNQTPEQIQTITADVINALKPLNSIIAKLDGKLGLNPEVPPR